MLRVWEDLSAKYQRDLTDDRSLEYIEVNITVFYQICNVFYQIYIYNYSRRMEKFYFM